MAEREKLGTASSVDSPVFLNNTIAQNNALTGGGAMFAATAVFLNNIVAENFSGLLRLFTTNEVDLQTNCVFGNVNYNFANLSGDSSNVTNNPLFIASGSDNFHLLATSPYIDAGIGVSSNWLLNEPARFAGLHVDLGAFELNSSDASVLISPVAIASSNQFQFLLTGLSGETYVIEESGDLINWNPVITNTTSNGSFTVIEFSYGLTNRFYRAIHVP